MRVVVVTCAHRGNDARIAHRQISALLDAGHRVTLVAPLPTPFERDGFRHVVIRRAQGRRRAGSWADVRRVLRDLIADLTLVHDIELLAVLGRRPAGVAVWDVHEDYAAAVVDRSWIPAPLRWVVRRGVAFAERLAGRRYRILLAEYAYRDRFPGAPVVPNTTVVPDRRAPFDSTQNRVVYLGRISASRGLQEMVELGRRSGDDFVVELIGAVDAADADLLSEAVESGAVVWHGYVANDEALRLVDGALAGLSLLHDAPNFVHSMPTKLVEYLAHGVPVVSTRLGVAERLVEDAGGILVDVGDVEGVERAVRGLIADDHGREALARRGYEYVAAHHNWEVDGQEFVRSLESMAATRT